MRRPIVIVIAVATVLALAVLVPACVEWWRIDACLDSGGAWNDETDTCER